MGAVPVIDLTAGEVKILGNRGDVHQIRLNNPAGQTMIEAGGTYQADFTSSVDQVSQQTLDLTELASGRLILPLTVLPGTYRVRRLNPRRTILEIEVEVS